MIDTSELGSIEKLLEEMNKFKGEKVFFMVTGAYGQVRNILLSQKFVEGVDFVNGFMFLSERFGFKSDFNTKPLFMEL